MNTDLWRNVFKFLDVDSCEIACEVFGKPANRAFEEAVCIVTVERFKVRHFACRTLANKHYDEAAARGAYVEMRNWRFKLLKEANVEKMYQGWRGYSYT
jgi:hypothetical protein